MEEGRETLHGKDHAGIERAAAAAAIVPIILSDTHRSITLAVAGGVTILYCVMSPVGARL